MSFLVRSVNWRDGMPLQDSDFRSERLATDERIRWALHHGVLGYGLVPAGPGQPDPLLLEAQGIDGKLNLHLLRCIAIAPDGSLIHVDSSLEIDAGGTPEVQLTVPIPDPQSTKTLHVFVEANSGGFREHGPPAPTEPPRAAWSYPEYELHVLDKAPEGQGSRLEIARFRVDDRDVARLDGFIPPCLSVGSHQALRDKARKMAGHMATCRNGAIHAAKILTSKRQGRGESGLSAVPAERFVQAIGPLAASAYSQIVDAGPLLSPRKLVGVGREFLRQTQALVDVHPELRQGTWEKHLRGAGRGPSDHIEFLREIESRLDAEIPSHPIAEPLNAVMRLVELVGGFPASIVTEKEDDGDPDDPPGTTKIYQGKTYHYVRVPELKYNVRQADHYLELHGFAPKTSGQFLIYLKCTDETQRAGSSTLKCGGPDQNNYLFMDKGVPDIDEPDAIILLLTVKAGQSIDAIYVADSQQNTDLKRFDLTSDTDVRLFHKP